MNYSIIILAILSCYACKVVESSSTSLTGKTPVPLATLDTVSATVIGCCPCYNTSWFMPSSFLLKLENRPDTLFFQSYDAYDIKQPTIRVVLEAEGLDVRTCDCVSRLNDTPIHYVSFLHYSQHLRCVMGRILP